MTPSAPLPLTLGKAGKRNLRVQFAALCYRMSGAGTEILLITSRGSGRWIVPKGWPMDARTPAECAAQEAWEEAGVRGSASDFCLGVYSYTKKADGRRKRNLPCIALLFPLRVESLADTFPEADQRKRQWFAPETAAGRVAEPDLAHLLRHFDPRTLPAS